MVEMQASSGSYSRCNLWSSDARNWRFPWPLLWGCLKPALFVFLCLLLLSPASSPQAETQRVLIISDGGLSAPAMTLAVQNIHETLDKGLPYHLEYYSEDLDYSLFPDDASQKRFRDFYVRKYQNRQPNLIITVGQASLRSVMDSHRESFPNVPVVYCCTSPQLYDLPTLDSSFTGTWVIYDPAKTIDAAIQLRPNTRQVFVVGGASPLDRRGEAMVKESLRAYEPKLEITYLVDLDIATLTEKLKHLPADSVVLFAFFLQDAAGRHFNGNRETVHLVSEAADVPVFVLSDALIGYGDVGGFVASYSRQGQIAAQMALQILQGKRPQTTVVTNAYVFDWRALNRWGLKESALPPGSIELFRQPSRWEAYKWYIVSGISLSLAEAILILGLLWQRTRRRKIESQLSVTNNRLRSALESGNAVGWEWDLKTGQDVWFGDLQTMFGIPSDIFVGRAEDFHHRTHPDDRERVARAVQAAMKGHTPYAADFRTVRPDGAIRWVRSKGEFEYSHKGEPLRMLGMAVDITDRKKLEGELLESEDRLASIVSSAMDAIIAVDETQRILLFNAAAEKMFGCGAADAIGSPIDSLIPERFRTVHSKHIRTFGETGATGRAMGTLGALWALRSNGEEFPIEASISHVEDGGKKLFTVIIRDVSARRKAEEALRQSEEKFSKAFRQSPLGIAITSAADHRYIDVNDTFERVSGWRREEVIGRTPFDIGLFQDPEERFELVRRVQARGRLGLFECHLRVRDGTIRVVSVGAEPVLLDGEPCILAVANDITEQKAAVEALRESESRLRLLLDSTAEAIYGMDLEGRCTFCNPACLRALGYHDAVAVLGKNMHQLIHHSHDDRTLFPPDECSIVKTSRTGEGVHVDDEVFWRANGKSFPVEYWSYPQRRDQKIIGVVVAFLDITERKATEAALASVSRRLIGAQEQERIRIARELHDDIGQRLALLLIELDQVGQSSAELPTEVRSLIGELKKQTSEIASDVQSLSHELHSSKLEYLGIATAIRGYCRELSEQQKVEIDFTHYDIPSALPKEISLCLFRVLQEGLQNAIKHSGVKQFDVELRYASGAIDLTVRDSGAGFDVLQVMHSHGLGLVSMAERVKLVDGRFSIDSQPQHGTTIRVRVPLSRAAGAPD